LTEFSKKKMKIRNFMKIRSSDSRVVPCEWTAVRTVTMNLIVAFRNFANASKNCEASLLQYHEAYYKNAP
jgi:hypothetical protein